MGIFWGYVFILILNFKNVIFYIKIPRIRYLFGIVVILYLCDYKKYLKNLIMKRTTLTICAILFSLSYCLAQKISWEIGNADVLKGQSTASSEIVYEDNLIVSDVPEKQFLEDRRKTDNAEKAGAGDAFCNSWDEAKKTKYIKRFSEYMTKASKEKITVSENASDAKYVIILTPHNIDLGKGKYFGTKPALVDFDIVIAENANRNYIVAKGVAKGVKGESKAPKGSAWIPGGAGTAIDVANRVQNFDATNRIAESFELLAVALGKDLRK